MVASGFFLKYTLLTFSGKGDKNLLEVAELIQADDDLYNFVQKELSEPWLVQITTRPPMQKKMLAMSAKCGDQLLKVFFVHTICTYSNKF